MQPSPRSEPSMGLDIMAVSGNINPMELRSMNSFNGLYRRNRYSPFEEFFMEEIWKPVIERPGYMVSNLGRVSSGDKILKLSYRTGYARIFFYKTGEIKSKLVHMLVMSAFVGPRPSGMQIAHLDGNRKNNVLSNLKYCTPRENSAHKRGHGTLLMGSKAPSSKLLDEDAEYIFKSRRTNRELAIMFNVGRSCIASIKNGESWSHLRGEPRIVRPRNKKLDLPLDSYMPSETMRLHMGEMTEQEESVARAAIRWANATKTRI